MSYSITVSPAYGWVILGAGAGTWVTSMAMGANVMKARKRLNVPYPNLYAVPGVHDKADEFNRIQRGHQNFMESVDTYIAITLIGGLKYPKACAMGTICYLLGSYLYQLGYSDTTLDVAMARYKKGGAIKWIGFFTSLFSSCALAKDIITSD